jgi:2-C-methyl-D-erythritol 4-phosphate cytidylyltransferase/2-C-methyl-D-erythritol 2,4-cyclodiphosphate synthase
LPPSTAVIIVAAGAGSRLGAAMPKAFVDVSGRSILEHSLQAVYTLEDEVQVIVVVPASHLAETRFDGVTVVAGGATRQQSVAAGLAVVEGSITTVLVHDAARSFTPTSQFERVIAAVRATGAGVIPALPVTDTIKRTDAVSSSLRRAGETIDRSHLVAVQTPQGFPRGELVAAYAAATEDYTDDAAVFAAAGHAVSIVDGDAAAFKITTAWDLRRAESLFGLRGQTQTRVGTGIDVHAFDDASPLWLGGLRWPGERGLSGHSDGDALCHAICDALLSAAGLGDLGSRFGTADPRFENAHGEVFLEATLVLVAGAGFSIDNVSVQVIANSPKVGPRREELEAHLSGLVGAPVSVAATTSDGLGFTGRGEGIAVIATALVHATQ